MAAEEIWRVDARTDEGAQLSIWNEGANATVGHVADLMEKLHDGEITEIVIRRDTFTLDTEIEPDYAERRPDPPQIKRRPVVDAPQA
jgi:hypothetical protein